MPQQATAKKGGFDDYITVAERIEQFYQRHPEGRIITQILEHDIERGFVLVRAEVYRNADDALPASSGHAYELKTEGYVQRTSYIEVCETSAAGRALAMAGFEVRRGIASREDLEKPGPRPAPAPQAPQWSEENWRAGEVARKTITDLESAACATLGLDVAKLRAKLKTPKPWMLNEDAARDYVRALRPPKEQA